MSQLFNTANLQVKNFIMEDIARLSKDANLAYYEMVLCKDIGYTQALEEKATQEL